MIEQFKRFVITVIKKKKEKPVYLIFKATGGWAASKRKKLASAKRWMAKWDRQAARRDREAAKTSFH